MMKLPFIAFIALSIIISSSFVVAQTVKSTVGEPCGSPIDCQKPLACVDGLCSENCYSHTQCDIAASRDLHCGNDNTCVADFDPGETCDESDVCPECECDFIVCHGFEDYFIDNLDGTFYCGYVVGGCFHKTNYYFPDTFSYLPDMENIYYCPGGIAYSWVGPACGDGFIWNPDIELPHEPYTGEMPTYGCIAEASPAPEFPSLALVSGTLMAIIFVAFIVRNS